MSDDRKKIQDLTERFTAKELAAAYLKASRRANEAQAKVLDLQKNEIDRALKGLYKAAGGMGL